MIGGLDELLEGCEGSGLAELRQALGVLLEGERSDGRVVAEQRLDTSGCAFRLRLEVDGRPLSLVAKRLPPDVAERCRFVRCHCLPAVGLQSTAPAIVATAADRDGRCVWQVYEDLGERTLELERNADAAQAAARLLGELHARFIGHQLLTEARKRGGERGASFYGSSVRDAIACLDALARGGAATSGGPAADVAGGLLGWMWTLRAQQAERVEAIEQLGGPETLLHGDMWLKNVIVAGGERSPVFLVDWDRAAVGPLGYDLSTFLGGFAAHERDSVLAAYEEAIAGARWRRPDPADLEYAFSSFELARLANCVSWLALAAADGAPDALAELDLAQGWFAAAAGSLDRA